MITDYERCRDRRVAENQNMLEDLGLNLLASEIITPLPQPAQKKGKNQQTRELITKISSSSEYLLDEDDQ
jgi:hypothetical protein